MPAATATVTRRTADLSDEAFARELFATSRLDLAVLPAQVRDPLLDMQFRAQRLQYAESFPAPSTKLSSPTVSTSVELIVDRGPGGVRIIDITVHPSQRGRGIATTVLAEELARADSAEIPVVLSVWSTNVERAPALRAARIRRRRRERRNRLPRHATGQHPSALGRR